MKNVVVLGAGYAGLKTVHELQKRASNKIHITLVDKDKYHCEKTSLHEVAAGTQQPNKICYPIKDIVNPKITTFIQDTVTGFDLKKKEITLANHTPLTYDYLVLALGFISETFGVQGAEANALPMTNLQQAEAIHQHILAQMDDYQKTQDKNDLNIIVAGAGFTGIELAGALADGRKEYASHAGVSPDKITITLVEASTHLLPMFPPELGDYGINIVKNLKVNLVTGAKIEKVEPNKVDYVTTIDDKEVSKSLTANTIIWTTGVSGSPLVQANPSLSARRGRVIPTDHLTVDGYEDVYIIGDVAAVLPPKGENGDSRPYPTTAQIALSMGKYVAEDIASRVNSGHKLAQPYTYKSLGTVASVGNTRAFGIAMNHEVKGYLASATKKMIANESLYLIGGLGEVIKKGRFDLYH